MGNEEGLNSSRFSTSITRLSCQDENGFFSCLCYALPNTLQCNGVKSLLKEHSCSDMFHVLASFLELKCKDDNVSKTQYACAL